MPKRMRLHSLSGVLAIVAALAVVGCSGQNDKNDKNDSNQNPTTTTERKAGAPPQLTTNPPAKKGGPLSPDPSDPPGVVEAKKIFMMQCATCHGLGGRGDGMAAAQLDPKPRNYTDKAWQASVTDDEIKKTIVLGGAGMGKSPLMPPNPQFEKQPEVVDGLVQIIRGFAAQ